MQKVNKMAAFMLGAKMASSIEEGVSKLENAGEELVLLRGLRDHINSMIEERVKVRAEMVEAEKSSKQSTEKKKSGKRPKATANDAQLSEVVA